MQVPLVVRGLLKLGKTCILEDSAMTLNRARNVGLVLSQLGRLTSASSRHKYLDGGKAGKYILLYHACSASAPLHVFATFFPSGSVKLHVVDPATRRQPIGRLQEVYADLLQKRRQSYGRCESVLYPDTPDFTTTYHTNDVTALKAVSRELGLVEDKSFTLVISSSKDQSYFDRLVPKMSKFPVFSMSKAKGPHTLDVFPWQSHVVHKMFGRYMSMGAWIDRLALLADYYDIPIGHVEGDQPLFLSDLSFARRLIEQDIILWWSTGEQPDLGGSENDQRPTEDLPKTEFFSSGCYANVCLEVTVRNLAVNSVIQSVMVNELEGSGGTTAFDSVSRTLDEYKNGEGQRDLTLGDFNVSTLMFSILKAMIKTWLLDKIQNNFQSPASLAIDHFWRWITSRASNMYDPSLHRFIHSLMRKTFIQLLAEFKRLGSQVVYADFSRILLATSKPPGTAHAYATYITTAVTSNELFQHIYLHTDRFYDFILFMDEANMGGIVCEDPLAVEPPEELSLEMRWNIQEFLPPALQDDFHNVVQYFIIELFKIKQKTNSVARVPLRMLSNGAPDSTQPDAGKVKEMEAILEFIGRRLTRKLLKVIGNIQDRYRDAMMLEEPDEDFQFPVRPGACLVLSNPTLELVKFICAIFALSKEHQVEIGLLKRNLLELVGVREFANEATFKNPCEPLKIANVPCRHCDVLRDFDFCRDPELIPNNLEVSPKWYCSNCGGEYDKTVIEFALMQMVESMERAFAQQDLRCSKCQQIRSDNLAMYCQCSGTQVATVNKAEMRRRFRTLANIATMHHLVRLKVWLYF